MSEITCSETNDCTAVDFDVSYRPPSEAVVDAVATVECTTATGLETPLYDAVDPEALDSLLTGASTVDYVSFAYCGHELLVEPDRVLVRQSRR